jgi:hypothetical protein
MWPSMKLRQFYALRAEVEADTGGISMGNSTLFVLPCWRDSFKTLRRQTNLDRAEDTSPGDFFASFRSRQSQTHNQPLGERKVIVKQTIQHKTIIPPVRNSIRRLLWRRALLLFPLVLVSFGLGPAPNALGVSPAPDGGYPGGNTAEGDSALFSLTTGSYNTANGAATLYNNTTGSYNTANGYAALFSNQIGNYNTAVGYAALDSNTSGYNTAIGYEALFKNTTGYFNTANGYAALLNNTTGYQNTAVGWSALAFNTGSDNTAIGFIALDYNTTGSNNTATGSSALDHNISGSNNTANGYAALYSNTSGSSNTAIGYEALDSNTNSNNTAIGFEALFKNTSGANNTANGFEALYNNTTGYDNTANGYSALFHNTANYNTANGFDALVSNTTGFQNTADGYAALLSNTTGNNNTAIGDTAGYQITGSGNVCIGEGVQGVAGEDNTTRIRNIYASVASDRAVYVNSNNKLGTLASSRRFKDEIKAMDKASEALLALKPVTFRYKKEIDPKSTPQFGLVAEDVEKVNPALVTRDAQGKPYTVRYEAVNAMLLNEFLKAHCKIEDQGRKEQELEATIAQQQKEIADLTASLKEQASQIQKVSVQLEASSPRRAPQVAGND